MIAYQNFEVLIDGRDGEYQVRVLRSPAGQSEVEQVALPWGSLPAPPDPLRKSAGRYLGAPDADLRDYGVRLFETFFRGTVRDRYIGSQAIVGAKGADEDVGLRIQLTINPPEIAVLPFELLVEPGSDEPIALSERTSIVRHPAAGIPAEPLEIEGRLRVLAMSANPTGSGLPTLDVERERRLVEAALSKTVAEGMIELVWVEGGTRENLMAALWSGPWHVFHFIGHGDFDVDTRQGYLVLEDEPGGTHRLAGPELRDLLRRSADVPVAVLNSCHGATTDGDQGASSVADALMRAGIGGVVAMQNSVSDEAATAFARVFYLALATGRPLDAAVGAARLSVKGSDLNSREWWSPVLHLRAESGTLFRISEVAHAHRLQIDGSEYLGPAVSDALHGTLHRRRNARLAVAAWFALLVPAIAYLGLTPVSSLEIDLTAQAAGLSFLLDGSGVGTARDVFDGAPRLTRLASRSFEAVHWEREGETRPGPDEDFDLLVEPGGPGPGETGPSGTLRYAQNRIGDLVRVELNHLPGYEPGEYRLVLESDSLHPDEGVSIQFLLEGPARLRVFGTRQARTFQPVQSVRLTGEERVGARMTFANPAAVSLPSAPLVLTELSFRYAGQDAPLSMLRSATISAPLLGTLGPEALGTRLSLVDARGTLDSLALGDSLATLVFSGSVSGIETLTAEGRVERRRLPPKLLWWIALRPFESTLLTILYVLIAAIGLFTGRTFHVSSQA